MVDRQDAEPPRRREKNYVVNFVGVLAFGDYGGEWVY